MTEREGQKRFPGWIRTLGWLIAVVWLALIGLWGIRSWLMRQAHERTKERVAATGVAIPPAIWRTGEPPLAQAENETKGDGKAGAVPLSELPFIGVLLGDDDRAIAALWREVAALGDLLRGMGPGRLEGAISFKAWLVAQEVENAEGLSEEQAAAEFLRRLEALAPLLQSWQQALEKGPWPLDFEGLDLMAQRPPGLPQGLVMTLSQLGMMFQRAWGAATEAAWHTGDAEAAWSTWRLMQLNSERSGDSELYVSGLVQHAMQREALETLNAGLLLNGWTDSQLAQIPAALENVRPLHSLHQALEGEKRLLEQNFANLKSAGNAVVAGPMGTPALPSMTRILDHLVTSLTTPQQLADNMAVVRAKIDNLFVGFDPVTGLLVTPEPSGSASRVPEEVSWFERYYFQYAEAASGFDRGGVEHQVVTLQSTLDQARLAAALEAHRRANGAFPESLNSLGDSFPRGLPLDVATGEPYGYRRSDDGTYVLWGRGVDQQDHQGDPVHDVVWGRKSPRRISSGK